MPLLAALGLAASFMRSGIRAGLRQAGWFDPRADRLELKPRHLHRRLHAGTGWSTRGTSRGLMPSGFCTGMRRADSGLLRWRLKAAGTGTAAKSRHAKGLGHFAGRRWRRSRHVARQVLLQRERDAELHCRFRSIPRQRIDRKHARQCCRHLHTGAPTSGQTASITITPTGGTAVNVDSDRVEHHKHGPGLRSVRHGCHQCDQSGGSDQS